MATIKQILVAVDFGESSGEALDLAIELARKFDASLTVVHTYEDPRHAYPDTGFWAVDVLKQIGDEARKQLESTVASVQQRVPGAKGVLRMGAAAGEILSVVEEIRPDLVVTGTHGRRGLSRTMLGSVAEKIVRLSPVPVLTVPRRVSAR